MRHRDDSPDEHERFKELAAAATAGILSEMERAELDAHLDDCEECLRILREYEILVGEGFRMLAGSYESNGGQEVWNGEDALRRLMTAAAAAKERQPMAAVAGYRRRFPWRTAWVGALAASLVFCLAIGMWRPGWQGSHSQQIATATKNHVTEPHTVSESAGTPLHTADLTIARLQALTAAESLEIRKLHSQLHILSRSLDEDHLAARRELDALAGARAASEVRAGSLSQQRDLLSQELRDSRRASEQVETELAAIRSERDNALAQLKRVENRLTEVVSLGRQQEQQLKDAERFLSSDRDIRDLMSARNLYIADVYDVDSGSRTRKPFGRIFYTQGKSLLFYAFDLDRQPRVKETSTFQVWGQKEKAYGETARPLDLGILYLDSESNRRWVLRFDDPQALSDIDAVFVTVEPRGGSRKPTGKPFLFAMLRREANHP